MWASKSPSAPTKFGCTRALAMGVILTIGFGPSVNLRGPHLVAQATPLLRGAPIGSFGHSGHPSAAHLLCRMAHVPIEGHLREKYSSTSLWRLALCAHRGR